MELRELITLFFCAFLLELAKVKTSSCFWYEVLVFYSSIRSITAPTGTKQKYQIASPKNIFISVKNVDKLKIEISLIGYIIAFVPLATQKTVMEILQ